MKLKILAEKSNKVNQLSLLEDAEFALVDSFVVSSDRSETPKVEELDLAPTDVLGVELQDELVWYAGGEDLEELFDLSIKRGSAELEVITLPNVIRNNDERGLGQFFVKAYHHFKRKKKQLTGNAAKGIAEKIEANIIEGIKQVNSLFELEDYDPANKEQAIDPSKPVLFFIHGTSSSTLGSFGEMKGTKTWIKLYGKYQQNILAFDHRTWSKSPLENALNILEQLPKKCELHLVTHSRGGLVGDVLCRAVNTGFKPFEIEKLESLERTDDVALLKQLNRVAGKKQIQIHQFIRVACPANGTTFLSKRLDHFLNILLNILPKTGNPIADFSVKAVKSLIVQTVGERNNPKVLPGLEAMVPDSPLLEILNKKEEATKVPTQIWVLAGHAGMGGVFKTLACILARLYYRMDNDFVVDTDSMFLGISSKETRYYKFVKGTSVDHFSYFKNEDTREALVDILVDRNEEKPSIPKNFKEIKADEKNRGVLGLDGGIKRPNPIGQFSETKPVLILIPGIMGSNLGKSDGNQVWLDYLELATGGLNHLEITEDLQPIGVFKSAYGNFIEYAEDKNQWEVLIFPYDWRKSLSQAGKALARTISNLQNINQDRTIALLGHSMGGLVIRELIFKFESLWKTLTNQDSFRCLLLGTPWKGSFLIPEFITGQGNRLKSLKRLFFYKSKKNLLEVFCQYPGLFELLPVEMNSTIPPFEDKKFWELLMDITSDDRWNLPSEEILEDFKAYRKALLPKLNQDFHNQDKVYYIAGKSGHTLDHLVFKHEAITYNIDDFTTVSQLNQQKQDKPAYKFVPTPKGDGSVTWESGIPEQLPPENIYYMDTGHGELVNDDRHFRYIFEILEEGRTIGLSQEPINSTSNKDVSRDSSAILSNDPEDLFRGVIGLNRTNWYRREKVSVNLPPLKVQMINGDLKYNKRPVMIGHFEGDGIVSAEKEMNRLLGGQLEKKRSLGIYPGAIGTYLFVENKEKSKVSTLVVGLGKPENLTPFELSTTVEQACLAYMSSKEEKTGNGFKLTSLLIGSGYANLNISNSLYAIIDGITNANRTLRTLYPTSKIITEIAFIELYEEKAITAFSTLYNLRKSTSLNFDLDPKLYRKNGKRIQLPIDNQKTWWNRFAVDKIEEKGRDRISITASTGRAGVGRQTLPYDRALISKILEEGHTNNRWDKELNQTAFELMIPNDLKISLKNQPNIIWVLDKEMAQYPWEMFQHDEKTGVPYCTKTGMIRQLSTDYLSKNINPISDNLALVIGDPKLGKDALYQLPAAKKEAIQVNDLLEEKGYNTSLLVNEAPIPILTQLRKAYKIIHIASHGVIKHQGKEEETGALLGDDIVINPYKIHQRTSTPELVFMNCCHLGQIAPADEAEMRNKNKFAASIGTELIEKGVKAVVVAGWAVDDNAALKFAEVFYENMLKGIHFGESVLRARAICYDEFPHTNTWGAYQCYGDPFYQLEKPDTKSSLGARYILEKEVLIDLESLISQSDSGTVGQKVALKRRLGDISKRISKSGIQITPAIVEKEAEAYAHLNLLKEALTKYKQLFAMEAARFEVKSIEKYCNLSIKYLLVTDPTNLEAADNLIKKLWELQEFAPTSERFSLIGSAYKRKTIMVEKVLAERKAYPDKTSKKINTPPPKKATVLEKMVDAYKEASLLQAVKKRTHDDKKPELDDIRLTLVEGLAVDVYWLENWLIGERLLLEYLPVKKKKGRLDMLNAILPTDSILNFLKEKLTDLSKKDNEDQEFWDLIQPANIRQCYLLFCDADKYETTLEEITKVYDSALNRGGTANNLATEKTQVQFMLQHLKKSKGNKELIQTIQKMEEYLGEKSKT